MTNVTRLKTDAEQAIQRAYAATDRSRDGAAFRDAGFARFEASGLPHRRVEAYKYTDLKALLTSLNPPALPASDAADYVASLANPFAETAVRVVLVDGVYRADVSELHRLPEGVTVTALTDVLAGGRADVIAALSGPSIGHDDPVLALNAALMTDGVVIEVADGVAPSINLNLVHVTTAPSPVSSHTRSLIMVGKGASIGIIETIEARVAGHQRTDVLNVVIGDGAHVEHAIAKSDASALDLATITAVIDGDATFRSFALVSAGDVTRRQHFVRMQGNKSMLSLRGTNLLTGRMHTDSTLTVEHVGLNCESRELYRHVVEDAAHGVFQGKVIVRPGAQKTDGKMASNALLLSENAEMDNKPELEIYADDVACGHGATCGAIDERPIFYLMSRGLSRPEAEALLIQSFVGEVVDAVGEGPLAASGEPLREAFTATIESWLKTRGTRS
jgi:Fe-S cluster assembly protein SufD